VHPNETLVASFYAAFNERDPETMAASYADDATFEDPAFGRLSADQARNMWRMLLGRAGPDLRAEYRDIRCDDTRGQAHWEAYYPFRGHPVHNIIDAAFTFRDGLIVEHVDTFSWSRWAAQALGLPGRLLGGTRFLHSRATRQAREQLHSYMRDRGGA